MEEWEQRIEDVRERLGATSLSAFVQCNEEPDLHVAFDEVVLDLNDNRRQRLCDQKFKIVEALQECHQTNLDEVIAYCNHHFGDTLCIDSLIEALFLVFRPDVGIALGADAVTKANLGLEFDKDHLVCGPAAKIEYRNEGILVGRNYVPYAADLMRYFLHYPDGLVDRILRISKTSEVRHLGFAVDTDLVMDRRYYADLLRKAYIRGAKDFSLALLRNPAFPEFANGSITVHQRVDMDEHWFAVDRLEVMWSFREQDNKKVVQIEEIVPPSPRTTPYVLNRYAHAEWDVAQERFTHFDGAIKQYDEATYDLRQSSDMKAHAVKPAYRKMFRLDAALTVGQWSDLVARFFSDNELMTEYLEMSNQAD